MVLQVQTILKRLAREAGDVTVPVVRRMIRQALADAGGSSGNTFETVSKNLRAAGAAYVYSGGELATITYANGVVKTFAYGVDGLSTVVLSGATPGGISLTKTFTYTAGELTGVSYS